MARQARHPRGFTLIELLIVIAVIGVAAAAAAPALSSLTGTNARAAAGEIAGASRFLYDTAALRHETCRLALDIDKRTWWGECTAAASDGRRRQPVVSRDGRAEDDEAVAGSRPADEREAEKRRPLARAKFAALDGGPVKKRPLPGAASFGGVWTPRQREPQAKGLAYVYFYPQGQADPAQVSVADGGHVYTVRLQPLTGHARVVSGPVEVPR
ncbi:MAG TPA: prepilin-type N-terminal cleavage/methylation domain-containing protein [Anaeromyxobacteraceae bacterium]|nr:prepilin-type N-terminal cleavage/methylation domain-containing protein [Anaeromyxobacteraceae bacterium]